jgi:hypothetical protein
MKSNAGGKSPAANEKGATMFWVIRGTDEVRNEDMAIVVEAETQAEAECMAIRRGFPLVISMPADDRDIRTARAQKRLFRYSPEALYMAFGRPVGTLPLSCLLLAGVGVIGLLLKQGHVPLPF